MNSSESVAASLSEKRRTWSDTAALYYRLAKPGIVYSNTLTAVSAYIFATRWHVHLATLLALTLGTMLLIASACVYNNYLDRNIDKKMERTRTRALARGTISARSALIYATLLGIAGTILASRASFLTLSVGLFAVFSYVLLYGYAKRQSPFGTLVGTLPGAASLIAGYIAAKGAFDVTVLLLFFIMMAWQMTHFYAIAIKRLPEYAAAGIPVWPVVYGVKNTAKQMIGFSCLFILSVILLGVYGHAGYIFAVVMSVTGLFWLRAALRGYGGHDASSKWAGKIFLLSLVVLLIFIIMLPLGARLP